MSYTKLIAKHDRIEIDGTDVSNAFQEFAFTSQATQEAVTGFSVSGNVENLPGNKDQGFTGTAFYTEEFVSLIAPLHFDDTVVEILYQPNGLVDSGATVFYGNCTIDQFGPSNTVGSVSTMPFSAKPSDEAGIQTGAGT